MTVDAEAWVPLAEVARAHGVRGEVRLHPYNRDSDLLLSVEEVLVRFPEGDQQEVSVDRARRANDAILMKLHAVDDRDRADSLRGAVVCVRRGGFPPLEPGEFYVCDVEGARVVVGSPGSDVELGRVQSVRTYPAAEVLVVRAADGGRPWEVPLVSEVVAGVDIDAGVVTLSTTDGVERA